MKIRQLRQAVALARLQEHSAPLLLPGRGQTHGRLEHALLCQPVADGRLSRAQNAAPLTGADQTQVQG